MFEEMVARQDPQLYVDLCEGKVKYSDPRVKKAFSRVGGHDCEGLLHRPVH